MSVKDLKAFIGRAGLSCIDCAEKSELRARAREALARLDEARRLESQRRAAEAPPPPPPPRQTARSAPYAPATYAADAAADEPKRQQLVRMGFDAQRAAGALVFAGGDVACSAALLRAWAEWRPAEPARRVRHRRRVSPGSSFAGAAPVSRRVRGDDAPADPEAPRERARPQGGRAAARELDVTLHEGFLRPADATALLRALTAPRSQGGEGLGLGEGRTCKGRRPGPAACARTRRRARSRRSRGASKGCSASPGARSRTPPSSITANARATGRASGHTRPREVDDAVGIYCVSLMEDEDATRPLSINPSRHYREADGPVSIEDIPLPHGSLPTRCGRPRHLMVGAQAQASRRHARLDHVSPQAVLWGPGPRRGATANSSGATPTPAPRQVTTGTCECMTSLSKGSLGSSAATACAT